MHDHKTSAPTDIELICLAQDGSDDAMEALCLRHTPLVKSIVRRFTGRGTEAEDLFQIGAMGLIKAIRNFDISYNVRFSTYAVPMIMGEIKRHIRDDGIIKVSRSLRELAARAGAAREALSSKLNREPTLSEIAEAVDADPVELAAALDAVRPLSSIYEPVYGSDSDAMLMDVIASPDEVNTTLDKVILKELLRSLEPRDRQLIILRFFLDKTQSETASVLGISQVQVSRIENKLLKRFREYMKEQDTPA